MGASESREEPTQDAAKELETTAATICHLPTLRDAFTRLCHGNDDHHPPPPHSDDRIPLQTLKDCFSFRFNKIEMKSPAEDQFLNLLDNVGEAIVDLFFTSENGQISWIEFLRGYIRCCGKVAASESLCNLYKLHAEANRKAGLPSNLDFVSDSIDCKINGYFVLRDVLTLLWLCWIMMHDSRISKLEVVLALPEVNHLLWSVILLSNEVGSEIKPMDQGNFDLSEHVSFDKVNKWALTVVPGLSNCISRYVNERMQTNNSVVQAALEPCAQLTSDGPAKEELSLCLLTSGCAWAISLTLRNFSCEELMEACVSGGSLRTSESLLYRSSIHGKRLNRFWSNIEGYQAPLLMLVAASTSDAHEANISSRQWVIGVLVQQGFENRDVYYGSPGFMYSLHPVFRASAWTGKDKNFVYSHLHATGRVYEANPRPVGIGFGGSIGNERVFIDEDFSRITVRHHAFDKTYQPGFLVPNQGFLAVEGSVLGVEVWGLGGKTAKRG